MPMAWKTENDVECPRCDEDDEIYVHEKDEGVKIKLQYTCEECGCEWSHLVDRDSDLRM